MRLNFHSRGHTIKILFLSNIHLTYLVVDADEDERLNGDDEDGDALEQVSQLVLVIFLPLRH